MNGKNPVSSRTLIAFIVAITGIVASGIWLIGEVTGVAIGAIVTLFTALIGYRQQKSESTNGQN